jgi:O-antigen/teichoic acid export membrane protein
VRFRHSLGWSSAFLVASRGSTVVAVPLLIHSFGTRFYAIWTLVSVLIIAQGLVDLGVGAATVRYVALATARGDRRTALATTRISVAFYVALSLLVAVPLFVFAHAVTGAVPRVLGAEPSTATTLIRYAAVAFGLTNVTLVLSAVLQGLGDVGASFRDQTIGSLLYLPVLLLVLGWDSVHVVGAAWLISYGVQAALVTRSTLRGFRRLTHAGGTTPPRFRQMLRLGGQWQVSAWADFASFQLPRLAAGLLLSSGALVDVDLATRLAQVATAPLFAVWPLVLPEATTLWSRGGDRALADALARWVKRGGIVLVAATAAAVPLAAPAIAAWVGRSVREVDAVLAGAVLLGFALHAWTGLFSSALLAVGRIRHVMWYKASQLVLGLFLVPAAAALGNARLVGLALGATLALPAAWFIARAARELSTPLAPRGSGVAGSAAAVAAATFTAPAIALWATRSDGTPITLLACAAAAAAAVMTTSVWWLRATRPATVSQSPDSGSTT